MTRVGALRDRVSEPWRYGLVGGLLSIPVTTVGYWQTGSDLSFTPVLGGAAVAGYLAMRQTGSIAGVGVRAGLVGALPVALLLGDLLQAAGASAGPAWFVGLAGVSTLAFVLVIGTIAVGLSAVVGVLGARAGGWIASHTGRWEWPTPGS